jgi:hypothetical protein
MIVISITESEIICTTAFLKNMKSSGYDGVSKKILRPCGKFLRKLLAFIFNNPLTQSKSANHLKYSLVTTLYKKGGNSQHSN